MKIKMNEYVQGNGISAVLVRTGDIVNILTPNEVYEVEAELSEFILSNRKGVKVEEQQEAKSNDFDFKERTIEIKFETQEEVINKKIGKRGK